MYHLKLIKALSYSGVVTATQKRPDVFIKDKAIADKAVATGYFRLENTENPLPDNSSSSNGSISDSLIADGENNDGTVSDWIISDSTGDSAPEKEKPQGKTLDAMTRAELETFAAYKNVSVKGLATKAAIIAKLRETFGIEETSGIIEYGSPTMAELQQE